MLLNDFQRGKLPHYMKPPGWTEKDEQEVKKQEEEATKEETDKQENEPEKSSVDDSNLPQTSST